MIGTKRLAGVSVGTQYRWLVALMVVVVSGIGTDGVAVLPWVALVVVVTSSPAAWWATSTRRPSTADAARRSSPSPCSGPSPPASAARRALGPPLVVLPLSRAAAVLPRVDVLGAALVWVLAALAVRRTSPTPTLLDVGLDIRWTLIAAVTAAGAVWVHRTNRVAQDLRRTTPNPPPTRRPSCSTASTR